jgi:hypothetical protein
MSAPKAGDHATGVVMWCRHINTTPADGRGPFPIAPAAYVGQLLCDIAANGYDTPSPNQPNALRLQFTNSTEVSAGQAVQFDIVASDLGILYAINLSPAPVAPPLHNPRMLRDANGWPILDANNNPRWE